MGQHKAESKAESGMQEGSPFAGRGCSHTGLTGFPASTSGCQSCGAEAEQKGRGLHWMCHGGLYYAVAPSQSVLPLHNCVFAFAAWLRHMLGWTRAGSSAVLLEQLQRTHGKWHMGQHVVGYSHTGYCGWAGVPSSQGNKHWKLWLKLSLLRACVYCCIKAFNQTVQWHVWWRWEPGMFFKQACPSPKKCGNISSLWQNRAVKDTIEISVKHLAATPLTQLEVGWGKLGVGNSCMPVPRSPFAWRNWVNFHLKWLQV